MSRFLLLICLAVVAIAQPAQDLVTNLPGAPTTLSFKMYAGYVPVGSGDNQNHYFYWFVESQRSPTKDPIVLWLNGGPGCSSLGGFLSENGPFSPNANGSLILNPYSWNTVANVVYLESPAGVGFSYCDNGCGTFTDNSTADDNYAFLVSWFKLFPSYASNDFYIAGESYAGHYIPELVYRIYTNTKTNPNQAPQSNFRGFAAGNPLTDQAYDITGNYLNEYMQTHGMIKLGSSGSSASGNYNPYDILVDVCNTDRMREYIRFPHPFNEFKGPSGFAPKRFVPNPPPCIDNFVSDYLNTASVQQAIHAQPTQWVECQGPSYDFSEASMLPLYQLYMNETKYKIWVYSGDADTVLNFIATEQWILDFKRSIVQDWTSWTYTHESQGTQLGGWTIIFDRLTFVTIKGAGHMVPWFQPGPALELFKAFLG